MKTRKIRPSKSRKTITIYTKSWTRGDFCNEYGHCCALGFLSIQTTGKIIQENKGTTILLDDHSDNYKTEILNNIVDYNDNLYGKKRRKKLREAFKELGYELRFVNK